MASNYIYGLSHLLIGDIAVDGGMSTTLTETFGDTVLGSAQVSTAEGTTTSINIEEKTDPIISSTQEGAMSIRWETYNCSPEALLAAFGGTVTGTGNAKVWEAPESNVQPEKSVRFETPDGVFVEFPRVKLNSLMNIVFDKQNAGKVTITGQVLAPTKVGTKKMKRGTIA